mmetsp:Transcript_9005/g.24960  ORF Transcript_9005/g.24960 Transcript_9005/m.24960 type:complete len:163 (-) Transcript_9005:166-654(-)|eukprot:CAMPEP_0168736606 /NCGR_PEP_ID=MMETSP0724-20121128/9947_1 /TAXON_ID=265536 /ORGANISM="Amphiprora sp., Strain CCMP467" /LENGTH=162 /DNA_ID=CAMNT_0008783809 /DNA_START=52 /DNA_END=540 /DNA_ORIENTATION=+
MKIALVAFLLAALSARINALAPQSHTKKNVVADLQKASLGAFAAATIAATSLQGPPAEASFVESPSQVILAEKVVRQGLYQEYEVEVTDQVYDDARSTFKSAKETKQKKGKYTALLAVLIVGSFIIPMAQYFWYVRDDDSTEKFFGQKAPEPVEPPKKKGWF